VKRTSRVRHYLLLNLLFMALWVWPGCVRALPPWAGQAAAAQAVAPEKFSPAELEKLVRPIALYPDLLLQQVLAASTFPEQILDAALYQERGNDPQGIKLQPWDESVKGVANYPSILVQLASDLDWTMSLGSAFINQHGDLRAAIQRLRARAKTLGNLKDSEQQHLIVDTSAGGTQVIRIESADPEVVYVPTTTTVYEQPASSASVWAPLASFGVGLALGYALGDDDDEEHYYYSGGFYGPTFWYSDDAFDDWVDYRHDRWNDAYDFANDRQDWRQDNRDDWREYRQDLGRKQREWSEARVQQVAGSTPEQRAAARTKAQGARAAWPGATTDQRRATVQQRSSGTAWGDVAPPPGFDREQASARLNQARANPQLHERAERVRSQPQVQQRAQASSGAWNRDLSGSLAGSRTSSLAGVSRSGSAVNRASARGAMSRASAAGFGRGGFSGGRRR